MKIDNTSQILLRYCIIGFSAITGSIVLYDYLTQYLAHTETVITGIASGVLVGLLPQLAIHKLTSMRKKNNVLMADEL